MILEGETPSEELGELAIFDNVHRQKGRWKCATLSTDGLKEYLNAKIPS
jgi:NifU-like protein involved in Fe-S cluster formation